MIFELERICEDCIKVLFDLKDCKEISEEELEIHLKTKLSFLKECEENRSCRGV